jgi:Transposase
VRDLLDRRTVLFAGWDWASASHAITIIDATGRVVDRATLTHTEAELDAALSRLAAHAAPADLPVAIEATNGLVVDRLLAAGHPVIPVHATAFHAARPRWSAAGPSPTPATATSSPTICAPMATGCVGSNHPMPPPASCKR